jgi:anti-sigma factor (TIGR02949 family)
VQCAESLRVQAYFDGEVDALTAAAIERHSEHCSECRALLEDLELTRSVLRRELDFGRAPPQLRARIARRLDQETAAGAPPLRRPGGASWRTGSFWAGAAGGLGTALAAGLALSSSPPHAVSRCSMSWWRRTCAR